MLSSIHPSILPSFPCPPPHLTLTHPIHSAIHPSTIPTQAAPPHSTPPHHQVHQSANYLGSSGRWGPLDIDRCKGFVDWLGDKGLLTTWKQSRSPDGATTGSLDDLRSGKVGEPVAREEYKDAQMFDNCLWE